jgi:hypothetical protein
MKYLTMLYERFEYKSECIPEFDAFFERLLVDTSFKSEWNGSCDAPYIKFAAGPNKNVTKNSYTFGVKSGILREATFDQEAKSFEFLVDKVQLNWANHKKLWAIYEKLVREKREEEARLKKELAERTNEILKTHP